MPMINVKNSTKEWNTIELQDLPFPPKDHFYPPYVPEKMVSKQVAHLTDNPAIWIHGVLQEYVLLMKDDLKSEYERRGEQIGLLPLEKSKPTACIHIRRGDKKIRSIPVSQPLSKYVVMLLMIKP